MFSSIRKKIAMDRSALDCGDESSVLVENKKLESVNSVPSDPASSEQSDSNSTSQHQHQHQQHSSSSSSRRSHHHHHHSHHQHHSTNIETSSIMREHPAAADAEGRSVTGTVTGDRTEVMSTATYQLSRYHDEPEVDYDVDGATDLYRRIENKDWDGAIARADAAPFEAKTWVSRREVENPNKVRWRLLPLHATCVFRSPLSLIEALIAAYPDGPQMKDDQGMLPVHLACRNGASKGVVITLLNAFPESIDVRDRKGRVPLSLVEASQSQNREAVILAMRKFKAEMENKTLPKTGMRSASVAQSQTRGDNEVDYENRTILFRLVLKKDWNGAVQRTNSYPDEAATWIVTKGFNGNLRFLPIHKACVLQPPEAVIESLVASFPDGAKSRDQDGWLPIHCATFYGAADGVVATLLVANPKGAQCKDDEGRLPLHYACLKGSTDGVVGNLLAGFPKGAMSKDDEGRLPIHYACSKGATAEVIEALLKASPKGAQSKDDQGRLPVHHACRKNATERVVKTLLRVYPRGAQVKDDQDKLPVHYACQNGADEGVIQQLLTAFPESINIKNGFGYTPLAEARAMDNPKMEGVVKILEKFKSEQDLLIRQQHEADSINNATTTTNNNNTNAHHHSSATSLSTPPAAAAAAAASLSDAATTTTPAIPDPSTIALEAKVSMLSQRVVALEMLLTEVGKVGRELKGNLSKGRESDAALRRFADKLSMIDASVVSTAAGAGSESGDDKRSQQIER